MRYSFFVLWVVIAGALWGQLVRLPVMDIYSEMGTNSKIITRHRVLFSLDGGAKYGFRVDMALHGIFTNAPLPGTNIIPSLDTFFFRTEPFGFVEVDYFVGNWRTLARKEYGYRGLQFFSDPFLCYEGAYDLRGTGVAFGKSFLGGMIYPHLLIYQPATENRVGFDVVVDSRIGNTVLEFSVGFSDINLYQAVVDNTLQKRYSMLIRSVYGKLDFEVGIGFPNSHLTNLPLFEEAYVHLAEHLVVGYFEQNLAIFARPTMYNGIEEPLRQDIDFYFSAGAKVLSYGVGFENTFLMSTNYALSDRMGLYVYNDLSTVRFKMGVFYNVLDGIWHNPFGMYFHILGKI
ncbi:hypothetical protein BREVNS_2452 [Brevinematales bacterium NS]|nr:hypothetical protein [Brevinematales bacterium]QJR23202.1 hypothetical protein BREVNS_2452 [Brevinematales bacterium NS]